MAFVTSKDGTRIGYSVIGAGPAIILVDGALCWRASGPAGPLAAELKDRFTVYTYDRRGRGESGDTKPYAIRREVEDLSCRYVGFEIPNRFVIGYGLDYAERFRSLPFVAVLDESKL